MAKMTLDELVSQLRSAYGSDLQSIVLYGSAAAGEQIAKRSDQNVLVILKSITPAALQGASAASRAWSEAGNPAPLTLTESEWRGSTDIFPIEYADILERHRVLYGADPTRGIQVDHRDLRLQLEQEAMAKLLRLRQGTLASGNDNALQLELLSASLSAIMVIFRAFLRLHGTTPPKDNLTTTDAVAQRVGFDPAPFARVIRHARGHEKLSESDAADVLGGYLRGMEQLVSYLDRYQPTT